MPLAPLSTLFATPAGPVWRRFAMVCALPRPSQHEEQVRVWINGIAQRHGWHVRIDSAGNIVVAVPGRGRLAGEPPLCLQGHMDMVCEKRPDVVHDFFRDPIQPQTDGIWVTAQGTTLGADNGVAMALALAVAEAELPDRLPLELLFTTDEETGLHGATGFDPASITARRVLNLDSEEDGVFIIGCAGGADVVATFPPLGEAPAPAAPRLACVVGGLRGGHSGVNIHEPRHNALRELADWLGVGPVGDRELCLHALHGGSKKNAIPRDARAVVSGITREALAAWAAARLPELQRDEPTATLTVEPATAAEGATTSVLPLGVLTYIQRLPHGVLARDPQLPTLVQTSNSLGVAATTSAGVILTMHPRSSSTSARHAVVAELMALAQALGGTAASRGDYPGWSPNPASTLLRQGAACYEAEFGVKPRIEAIHAGLEAGILGAALGTGELLAYGPTIENAHSPDERLSVESLARTWRWLCRFVSTPLTPAAT